MENIGQAAIGILLALVAVGGLLYIFYSRTNAVEKTGYGSLIMLGLVSLMIPVFWILEDQGEANARNRQQAVAIERGMKAYAQYCQDECYTIKNGKIADPKYNGYTFAELNKLTDDSLERIVSGGLYKEGTEPSNPNAIVRSNHYGGQLDTMDVSYIMAFIRSDDPNYAKKNGYVGEAAINGLEALPEYLQLSMKTQYDEAVKLGAFGQFGEPVDLTNQQEITIDIVDPAQAGGKACPSKLGCYLTINAKVKVGTKITWVNKSVQPHTVTAVTGGDTTKPAPEVFDSANGDITNLMKTNDTFSWTVTQDAYNLDPNEHKVVYFCRIHPDMVAQLVIVP